MSLILSGNLILLFVMKGNSYFTKTYNLILHPICMLAFTLMVKSKWANVWPCNFLVQNWSISWKHLTKHNVPWIWLVVSIRHRYREIFLRSKSQNFGLFKNTVFEGLSSLQNLSNYKKRGLNHKFKLLTKNWLQNRPDVNFGIYFYRWIQREWDGISLERWPTYSSQPTLRRFRHS